jgi:hypothetical protein
MVVVIEDMGISNPMIGSFSPSGAYFYDIAEGTNYFDIGSFSVSDTAEIGWSATQNFKISFLNPDSPTDYSSLSGSFDVRVVPGPVVPVPSALLLLGSGLAGVIGLRRKRLLK